MIPFIALDILPRESKLLYSRRCRSCILRNNVPDRARPSLPVVRRDERRRPVRVACVQMNSGADKAANVAAATDLVRRAAAGAPA